MHSMHSADVSASVHSSAKLFPASTMEEKPGLHRHAPSSPCAGSAREPHDLDVHASYVPAACVQAPSPTYPGSHTQNKEGGVAERGVAVEAMVKSYVFNLT